MYVFVFLVLICSSMGVFDAMFVEFSFGGGGGDVLMSGILQLSWR